MSAVKKSTWVEKYRPITMDQVAGQDTVIRGLAQFTSDLPHLLFYGPPGTGKTSTVHALARTMYGENYMTRMLELNASNERGIDVVRTKIKTFAKTHITNGFKIILLDEADSMTTDAQSALRRIMEQYSKSTRFCLICNYVTRIIDPIASRCSKFRFAPLDPTSTKQRIRDITLAELCNIAEDAIDLVVEISEGDLRRAITYVQTASKLSELITTDLIMEVAGVVPTSVVTQISTFWGKTSSIKDIYEFAQNFILDGHSFLFILHQILDKLVLDSKLTSIKKAEIAQCLAKVEFRLLQGAEESIQLAYFIASTQ